jgi:hypothetical protein
MHWIAPAAKDAATATLEKQLWDAADELRANSGLTSAQYGQPVLGLIFLRFADAKFAARRAELEKSASGRRGPRVDEAAVIDLRQQARRRGSSRSATWTAERPGSDAALDSGPCCTRSA